MEECKGAHISIFGFAQQALPYPTTHGNILFSSFFLRDMSLNIQNEGFCLAEMKFKYVSPAYLM
jgi:hypothetical protein